jgi:hypothetical protein
MKHKRVLQSVFALVFGLMGLFAMAASAHAQDLTQSYGSDQTLQIGTIVSLKSGDSSKVVALKQSSATDMFGVVVSATDAPVALSYDTNQTQVFVATYGNYNVLVSNQGGQIHSGDYITISSLDGVGQKAGSSQSVVVGKALASFDGISNVESTTTLTNSIGSKTTVALGRIPVAISVSHNPLQRSFSSNLPGFLQKAAQSLANKPVTDARVYVGIAAMLITMIIVGCLLYAGVRSSMIAIGRNPLAKRTIMRNLLQVTLISLIVFIVGLFAVYLILKV